MYQDQELQELALLDFAGKGEAFVEARFLTPLLAWLGYESHRDYEVRRHGDKNASFKLQYPPVEKGAKKVRHYNPDYIPTIRKKMFWIIEAKSPRDVSYPFDAKYLVQGLQYCIHPEIQAKYLMVTNGLWSAIYDAHGAVFLERDIYEPLLFFQATELLEQKGEIFNLLSVEKLRSRIETDLKAMYDKLCLSSLDKAYPARLLQLVGSSSCENARQIEKHVRKLCVEGEETEQRAWLQRMERLAPKEIYLLMDLPLRPGPRSEATFYVRRSLAAGVSDQELFDLLTGDFEQQGIFRMLQSFKGVIELYFQTSSEEVKSRCRSFLDTYKDAKLPIQTQVECVLLRLTHKIGLIYHFPNLREQINEQLKTAPELVRFVSPPTAVDYLYPYELDQNRIFLQKLRLLPPTELPKLLEQLEEIEITLEDGYRAAKAALREDERIMCGFDTYGIGGTHYAFKGMLNELGF